MTHRKAATTQQKLSPRSSSKRARNRATRAAAEARDAANKKARADRVHAAATVQARASRRGH